MLSIIIEYYFCVGSTYKSIMTLTLSSQAPQRNFPQTQFQNAVRNP